MYSGVYALKLEGNEVCDIPKRLVREKQRTKMIL
jgi:hypothetical protein